MKIIITSPTLALIIGAAMEYAKRLEGPLLASAFCIEILAMIFY